MFKMPEKFRVGKNTKYTGNNGSFIIRGKEKLLCTATDAFGWEHVVISKLGWAPDQSEVQMVRDLFWDPSDWVVQFFFPETEPFHQHPWHVHLWRPHCGLSVPQAFMMGITPIHTELLNPD
jgi:hypothetical protein